MGIRFANGLLLQQSVSGFASRRANAQEMYVCFGEMGSANSGLLPAVLLLTGLMLNDHPKLSVKCKFNDYVRQSFHSYSNS